MHVAARRKWLQDERKKRLKALRLERPKLHDHAPIFIPGVALSRADGAFLGPIHSAAHDICERLERQTERLDGIPDLSRPKRIWRSLALWLIQAPDNGPEATEDDPDLEAASRALCLELQDLPLKRRTPFSGHLADAAECSPNDPSGIGEEAPAPLDHSVQGVR